MVEFRMIHCSTTIPSMVCF